MAAWSSGQRRVAAAAAVALLLGARPAPARGAEPASAADLCVVRVEDTGGAGAVDADRPYRLLESAYTFPGSPLVVLDPRFRPGIWTLSDDRRFVRIADEALPPRGPTISVNTWPIDSVVEPHSSRALGVSAWGGVWKLAPGGERFVAHRPEQWPELGGPRTRTVAHVPAWRATVFGGVGGLFVARDDDPIAPVPGPDGLPLGYVTRAVAVPGRGAVMFGTIDGGVGLVTGEHGPKRVQRLFSYPTTTDPATGRNPWMGLLAQARGSDDVAEVLPLPSPDTFLVRGGRHAHVVTLPSGNEEAVGEVAVEEVERAPSGPPSNAYRKLTPGTGEYLVYVPVAQRERLPARAGLFRLEGTRFVPVPGGDAATLGGNGTRLYAVPSRSLVVASRADGRLLVYRDGALAPVQDGDAAGPNFVHELPVVGRVVITSLRGVFELTQDLRLVPVPAPVPLSWIAKAVEMPPSGVAAVIAEEGVFALGPEGSLAPVLGGEAAGSRVANHVFLPSRNELLYTGDKGLFLLADRRLSGPDGCARPPP